MKTEITIQNPRRCRKFGYGVSTTPSGQGTDITQPRGAGYSGTIKQIDQQIADDYRYLNSIQSAYKSTAVFYDGQIVDAIWDFGIVGQSDKPGAYVLGVWMDDAYEDVYGERWCKPTLNRLRDLVESGKPLKLRFEVDENYLESISKKLKRPNAGRKPATDRCACGEMTAARAAKRNHKCG